MNNNIQELKQKLRSDWKMFQGLLGGATEPISNYFYDTQHNAELVSKKISMINLLLNGQVFPGDTQNICSKLHMDSDCIVTLQKCFNDGDASCKNVFASSSFLKQLQDGLRANPTFDGQGGHKHLESNLSKVLQLIGINEDRIDADAAAYNEDVFNAINNMFEGLQVLKEDGTNPADANTQEIAGPLYNFNANNTVISINQRYLQYCASVIHKIAKDNLDDAKNMITQLKDPNKSAALKHLIRVYVELKDMGYKYEHEFRNQSSERPKLLNLHFFKNNPDVLRFKHANFGFVTLGLPFLDFIKGGMTGGSVYPGIQFGGFGKRDDAQRILQSIINRNGVLVVDYLHSLIESSDDILKTKGLSIDENDKKALKEKLLELAKCEEEIYKIAFYINSIFNLPGVEEQTGGATDLINLLARLSAKKTQKQQRLSDSIGTIMNTVNELKENVNSIVNKMKGSVTIKDSRGKIINDEAVINIYRKGNVEQYDLVDVIMNINQFYLTLGEENPTVKNLDYARDDDEEIMTYNATVRNGEDAQKPIEDVFVNNHIINRVDEMGTKIRNISNFFKYDYKEGDNTIVMENTMERMLDTINRLNNRYLIAVLLWSMDN